MSRYFDLVQQIGLTDGAFTGKRSHFSTAVGASEAASKGRHVQAGSFSSDILDLVQRIFLLPAENAPRVVLFAPVDRSRIDPDLCSSVSQTLSRVSRSKVCLVKADFRRASSADELSQFDHGGLADALAGEESIHNFCRPMGREKLWLLPSGAFDADSPSLITPERLKDRFAELRAGFDFVVIEAASLALYVESMILSRLSDGVAVVLNAKETSRHEAGDTVASLQDLNIPIVAAVLSNPKTSGFKSLFR